MISRRSFLGGLGGLSCALVTAPAIVQASSLMPLRGTLLDPWLLAYRNGARPITHSAYDNGSGRWPLAGRASIARLARIKNSIWHPLDYDTHYFPMRLSDLKASWRQEYPDLDEALDIRMHGTRAVLLRHDCPPLITPEDASWPS